MKKTTSIAAIGLLLAGFIYYFTTGSTQLIEEMKKQVNHELTTLQKNGFTIEQRETKKNQEHFVLSFSDTKKISSYFNTQGVHAKSKEIEKLQGLKVGVDTTYLNDTYSALSVDIYPLTLPHSMKNPATQDDKKILEHLQKMLKRKALLMHVDFNKLLTGFKGYIKDINETFINDIPIDLLANGMTFEGSIEDKKFKGVEQKINLLSLSANKGQILYQLSHLQWHYTLTGTSMYDTHTKYQIGELKAAADSLYTAILSNLKGESTTLVKHKLLQSHTQNSIETINIQEKNKHYLLKETILNAKVNNLDMDAFEKMQKVDPEDYDAVNKLTQQMISKGVLFTLNELSAKEVSVNRKSLGSFNISGSAEIDKNFKMNALKQNPLAFLTALNTKAHISLSSELFSLVMQNPKAMLALMLFPPQEKNGQKMYDISYIKGKLTVNGVSL